MAGRNIGIDVFSHETCDYPPAFTKNQTPHHGTKSEVLQCLYYGIPMTPTLAPMTTAAVLDGSVMVHMLRPGNNVTFANYMNNIITPHIWSWLEENARVDRVFDVYLNKSPKQGTSIQ